MVTHRQILASGTGLYIDVLRRYPVDLLQFTSELLEAIRLPVDLHAVNVLWIPHLDARLPFWPICSEAGWQHCIQHLLDLHAQYRGNKVSPITALSRSHASSSSSSYVRG